MLVAARLLKLGLHRTDPVTATCLLKDFLAHRHPYSNSLAFARYLFDQVPIKDTVLWTAMISAYARSHQPLQALHLLSQMHSHQQHSTQPNEYTYASVARAAGAFSDHWLARTVHAQVIIRGLCCNVVTITSVLDMYAKCNDIVSAHQVFDAMPERNRITWNSMLAGYAIRGMGVPALELFDRMRCVEFAEVDEFTVTSLLTACAGIGDLLSGMQIHGYFIKMGFEDDPAVANAACNMYFRCGEVEFAERMMEGREGDVLSKLTMVKGYAFNGRHEDVIRSSCGGDFLKAAMRDCSVFVSVLSTCVNLTLLRIGRQIHGLIVILGYCQNCHPECSDRIIIGSTLIDMYYRCTSVVEAQQVFDALGEKDVSYWNSMVVGSIHNGLIDEARRFFDEMPKRNMISWTAMISGYTRLGMAQEGLRLVSNLYKDGFFPWGICPILTVALDACSCLAALDVGKQLHALAIRATQTEVNSTIMLETALVDMYSRSGDLKYARKIFDRMGNRNVVSWTSMIASYASHGLAFKAVEIFKEILKMGLEPNEVTFVAVLNACSHCGLVDEGLYYFKMMREKYGIVPWSDHCTCIVDMLARAGKLAEAWNLIEGIKELGASDNKDCNFDPKEWGAIWGALLSGCWLHGDTEMGSTVARKMLESNLQTTDTYIALSNVYAAADMWDKVYEVRKDFRSPGVVQNPGYSRIQIGSSG